MKTHQIPEIVLGTMLAIATFAVGYVVGSSLKPDWVIVVLTIALLLSAYWQTKAAWHAANTASRAVSDLQRPYIYVLGVRDIAREDNTETPYEYINYSVANYGKTPATIESIRIGVNTGDKPAVPQSVTGWHDLLVSPILTPGERRDGLDQVPAFCYIDSTICGRGHATRQLPNGPVLKEDEQFYFWIQIRIAGLSAAHTKLMPAGNGIRALRGWSSMVATNTTKIHVTPYLLSLTRANSPR